MPADPRFSAGARYERKAFRAYLKRRLLAVSVDGTLPLPSPLLEALNWVLGRQARYDKKPKGLGK